MKKNLLLFNALILLICNHLMAQTQLWSTSQQGGANNAGTIFKLNNANIISYAHEFTGGLNGQQPMGNLCVVNNEYIYGTTVNGGINNNGICFKFNMNTSTLTKIHDFTDTSAYYSTNGLIKGTDGNLYGTAGFGGAFGGGVIFKIDPITDQYSVLHNFDMPSATVWEVINNKLYGITKYTIANPLGNLFSFDLSTNTYTVLHENDSLTGYAAGTLLNIGGGTLIGTANSNSAASTPDYGVLYSYDLNTNTRTVLHHFDTLTGFGVHAQLLLASDGKIYGTSSAGGTSYPNNLYFPLGHGVIFSFDLNTNVYSVLYNYEIAISGSENQCGMMQASNGLLYTATYDACKLFSYDIGSNTFTIVNNFTGVSGINPSSPLIEIGAVTAINNKDNNNKISVSPNPAQGYIMINNRDTASIVTCIDILGREIEQIQLVDFGKTRVDLSAFPNVFFVKDNYGEVLKVMKQ